VLGDIMNLTLELDEPLALRLQRQASQEQLSVAEFICQFLEIHWVEQKEKSESVSESITDSEQFEFSWDDSDWEEWDNDDWIQNEASNLQQPNHIPNDDTYWKKIYAELKAIDPEHEAQIEEKYGPNFLDNTSHLIDTGLPDEEVRYLVESPELSEQSYWVKADRGFS